MFAQLICKFFRSGPERLFKNFLIELDENLEEAYAMEQRGFISKMFKASAIENYLASQTETLPQNVLEYIRIINEFNHAFQQMIQFESFYMSCAETKTLDNAKILHRKKEALEDQIPVIKQKILAAREALKVLKKK